MGVTRYATTEPALALHEQARVAKKTDVTVCYFYRDGRLCWENIDNT